MANQLDELDESLINEEGVEIHVIQKRLPVELGSEGKVIPGIFNGGGIGLIVLGIILSVIGLLPVGVIFAIIGIILLLVFYFKKKNAEAYFDQLQQKIQQAASQVDNYLEQRLQVLKNAAKLLDKALQHESNIQLGVANARGGAHSDTDRNELASNLASASRDINVAIEAYPNLEGMKAVEDCMVKNDTLQREITAARDVYNDVVARWNSEIFRLPFNKLVAAKKGFTTRIPFTLDAESKAQARGDFF